MVVLNKREQKFKQDLINNQILVPSKKNLKIFDNIVEIRNFLKNKPIYFYKKKMKKMT